MQHDGLSGLYSCRPYGCIVWTADGNLSSKNNLTSLSSIFKTTISLFIIIMTHFDLRQINIVYCMYTEINHISTKYECPLCIKVCDRITFIPLWITTSGGGM